MLQEVGWDGVPSPWLPSTELLKIEGWPYPCLSQMAYVCGL